jgi:AraC-like DNA-binding protein
MTMQFHIDWISLLYIIGISYGIFFATVLFGIKRKKQPSNRLLAFFVLSYAMFILPFFLTRTGALYVFPHFIGVSTPFYFTLGPLFFLYVLSLTTPEFQFRKTHLLHLIPFGLSILSWIPFYAHTAGIKLDLLTSDLIRSQTETNIIRGIRLIHLFVYLVLIAGLIKKHKHDIKESFSAIDKIKLGWIEFLILLLVSDVVGYFILTVIGAAQPELYAARKTIFGLWKVVVIFLIGYKGLTQTEIYTGPDWKKDSEKYRSSKMTPLQAEAYLKTLTEHMESEKPYLENELTLNKLASQIEIGPRHLSQVINEKLNRNFFDFVNRYRVEEAKKLLVNMDTSQNSILDIAFDSGFNSKSSFNMIFKKYTAMTPSQFRKKYEENCEAR